MRRTAALLLIFLIGVPAGLRAQTKAPSDPWFAADKLKHFTGSAALAAGGYTGGMFLFNDPMNRILLGVSVGMSVGTIKELHDKYTHGDASWKDFTWDAMGTASGVAVAWLVDRLIHPDRPPITPTPGRIIGSSSLRIVIVPTFGVRHFSERASNGAGSRSFRR